MNTSIINEIQNKIIELTNSVVDLQRQVTAIKIDKQTVVKAEKSIRPGVASKVAYTSAGLITESLPLTPADIPALPMSKIDGLNNMIDATATKADLDKLENKVDDIFTTAVAVDSGCKVNIDKHGLVTAVSELSIEDIPELPISKIKSLSDQLNLIKSIIPTDTPVVDAIKVRAGSGCKVTWNDRGQVIASTQLSITDIPSQIVDRLTNIENMIPRLASTTVVDQIKQSVSGKVDANPHIKSGIYPKVVVDNKGLVTKGISQLSKTDLPELTLTDIKGLLTELNQKATIDDIHIIVNNSIKSIQTQSDISKDITNIKHELDSKSTKVELTAVRHEVKELEAKLERSFTALPSQQIITELNMLKNEISTINGKLLTLSNIVDSLYNQN